MKYATFRYDTVEVEKADLTFGQLYYFRTDSCAVSKNKMQYAYTQPFIYFAHKTGRKCGLSLIGDSPLDVLQTLFIQVNLFER